MTRFALAMLGTFISAMLLGWMSTTRAAKPTDPQRAAYERHMSGGADLYANNPFVKGTKP